MESGHEEDGHLPAGDIAGGTIVAAAAASGDTVLERVSAKRSTPSERVHRRRLTDVSVHVLAVPLRTSRGRWRPSGPPGG